MRGTVGKIREEIFARPIERFCDAFFIFYALWTLIWAAAYTANLSLSEISPLFLLALPISAIPLALKRPLARTEQQYAAYQENRNTWIVLAFVLAGILLTLVLHRPDADDELYLGMALSLLANADQPIQNLPGFGEGVYANNFTGINAYEPLKAMVSYLTGLPVLDSYYLLVPSLMAAMTVIITYRLLRKLVPEGWLFGMLFFFVVMLAWGDVHRTLANFGFVRMFQGKSVLVSVVVPAILFYAFLLRDRAQARYHGFLLAAAIIAGVGVSRGGLIIAPLLLIFIALAAIKPNTFGSRQKLITIFLGSVAIILLPVIYHSGWSLMNPSQLVYKGWLADSTTNLEMIQFTMGSGLRAVFLIACVLASFLFVEDKELRYWYRNYILILLLLLVVPWTSNFFAKTLQEFLSWRWMWIMPIPVLASVAVGGALARVRQTSNSAVALGVFVAVAVGFSAASPRRVVSEANYTSVRWPDAKLDGDSVYLRPYEKAAAIRDGTLHMDCYGMPYLSCQPVSSSH